MSDVTIVNIVMTNLRS